MPIGVETAGGVTTNTLNEGKPRIDSKRRQEENEAAGQEALDWLGENQLAEQAAIENDSLCEGIDYSCSLSQARFEELCMDYSRNSMASWKGACETKVSSRRTCMTRCLWEARPESQKCNP